MNNIRKIFLYFLATILGLMIWHAWLHDHPAISESPDHSQSSEILQHPVEFAPPAYGDNSKIQPHSTEQKLSTALPQDKMISVKTDALSIMINLRGGDIVSAQLLHYPISLTNKTPIQILNPNNSELYVAQSGLSAASDNQSSQPIDYQTKQQAYQLNSNEQILTITLTGKTADGLLVEKTYTLTRGSYVIKTTIQLINRSQSLWKGGIYNQITRRNVPADGSFYSRAYTGAAISTPDTPYKKLSFTDMMDSNLSLDVINGWAAMQQHYFLSVWIPAKEQSFHYYSRTFGQGEKGENNIFVLGYVSPQFEIKPSESQTFASTFYVGPEIASQLEKLGRGLDLTVDYGWLWPISKFLFWLLSEIHQYIGNWGWSIILVTILIKIAFYWFSNKSYYSMAKTRDLQPRLQALRERCGDDKQALSKAMMDLYRKEKINPLGGCLPMVIQIPVFIALYYVLIESVELRQAPFILWIHDLSIKDPYFILPVLMGASMLIQQKLSPPPPDPAQAKMMMFLPIIFTIFFATFPAGLVLYWLTNNCVSILQQWYVMKTHHASKNKKLA